MCNEKKTHIQRIITIIHTIIRGFILYQIEIIYSNNSIIISKNQSTKIQELSVQITSRILLFHWYIKVHITIMANATAIINGIIFELLWNITKNLHITKKNIHVQNRIKETQATRINHSTKYKNNDFFLKNY